MRRAAKEGAQFDVLIIGPEPLRWHAMELLGYTLLCVRGPGSWALRIPEVRARRLAHLREEVRLP